MDAFPQGGDEFGVGVHGAEETEGVASANEEGLGFADGCHLATWDWATGYDTVTVW